MNSFLGQSHNCCLFFYPDSTPSSRRDWEREREGAAKREQQAREAGDGWDGWGVGEKEDRDSIGKEGWAH